MITVDYLKEWEDENGEDVIFDGPFDYTEEQYDKLMEMLSDAYVEEFGCEPFEDLEDFDFNNLDDVEYDKAHEIALKCFSDLINKENIKEY